jgi:hypothetical protein
MMLYYLFGNMHEEMFVRFTDLDFPGNVVRAGKRDEHCPPRPQADIARR